MLFIFSYVSNPKYFIVGSIFSLLLSTSCLFGCCIGSSVNRFGISCMPYVRDSQIDDLSGSYDDLFMGYSGFNGVWDGSKYNPHEYIDSCGFVAMYCVLKKLAGFESRFEDINSFIRFYLNQEDPEGYDSSLIQYFNANGTYELTVTGCYHVLTHILGRLGTTPEEENIIVCDSIFINKFCGKGSFDVSSYAVAYCDYLKRFQAGIPLSFIILRDLDVSAHFGYAVFRRQDDGSVFVNFSGVGDLQEVIDIYEYILEQSHLERFFIVADDEDIMRTRDDALLLKSELDVQVLSIREHLLQKRNCCLEDIKTKLFNIVDEYANKDGVCDGILKDSLEAVKSSIAGSDEYKNRCRVVIEVVLRDIIGERTWDLDDYLHGKSIYFIDDSIAYIDMCRSNNLCNLKDIKSYIGYQMDKYKTSIDYLLIDIRSKISTDYYGIQEYESDSEEYRRGVPLV